MCSIGYATAASMGMQAIGGLAKGNSANQAASYNASVANTNANLADIKAQDALQRGANKQTQYANQTRQIIGKQRTANAANNIDPSQGSAVNLLTDTTMNRAIDQQRIRANAAREAYGYKTQASSYRAQAKYQKYAGRQQESSSILGGLVGAASTYGQYKLGKA